TPPGRGRCRAAPAPRRPPNPVGHPALRTAAAGKYTTVAHTLLAEAAMAVPFAYVVCGGFLAWRRPRAAWPPPAAASPGLGATVALSWLGAALLARRRTAHRSPSTPRPAATTEKQDRPHV